MNFFRKRENKCFSYDKSYRLKKKKKQLLSYRNINLQCTNCFIANEIEVKQLDKNIN